MKADILRALLQAHASGDEAGFHKAALQLASAESTAGHVRVAEELRAIIAKMPPPGPKRQGAVVDIAQPRGDLAEILAGAYRDERLGDVVLPDETRRDLERLLRENRSTGRLEKWGVGPRRRVLFHGPPGCGKTLTAASIAGELGLPLMTIRVDALFSRFLGATATHLRSIFAEMPRRPGVYLFDEFDAVAKARGDNQDVGEMGRIVTAFLQLIDADVSTSLLIAATNHSQLLDRAVFRRFDLIVPFQPPSPFQVERLLELRLGAFDLPKEELARLASETTGMSYADLARACDDAIREMALDARTHVTIEDLVGALEGVRRRDQHLR
ncbi:MAG: ATP-binding protein [Polyangiaceae bacterium]|nr:ATP-binding protein [Polyangiaceae bacterium]